MIIITNNRTVKNYFDKDDVCFIEGDYSDVLCKTRDYVHNNYTLLTHPLSGSVKPNETPYKTIAVEPSNTLNFDSLRLIENAIAVYRTFQEAKVTPHWTKKVKDDFMVIDLDLIKNALKR